MNETTTLLADLGSAPLEPTSPESLEHDVVRGRRALRRRRSRFAAGALVAGVGLAGGAVALTSGPGTVRPGPTVAASSAPTTAPPTAANPLRVDLVVYTGQEPEGFHIGTVPQGFDLDLQASTPNEVLIAPEADADTSPDSFEGKLAVTAEAASEMGGLSTLGSSAVTVGQYAGRIGDDGTATQVWWQVGSTILDVQCWDTIGLTHAQVVEFASSVSMTSQVQLSHG